MSEREMLIGLLEKAKEKAMYTVGSLNNGFGAWFADYLLANGVIVPPCKVGDTVYLPWMYGGQKGIALCSAERIVVRGEKSYVETSLSSDDDGFLEEYNYGEFYFTDFGKTVFTSREEAEKALESA